MFELGIGAARHDPAMGGPLFPYTIRAISQFSSPVCFFFLKLATPRTARREGARQRLDCGSARLRSGTHWRVSQSPATLGHGDRTIPGAAVEKSE